ncbi:unnamed protein product [Paramecium pentaurelia]|uniref:Uncharacterized protein n=1 Tax=Paramecium pentaurelia TaxID=43138 RepID=A0A8S1W526_9CILI|nr:unnamed protein product [Paramecium pentaurelia]
MSEKLPKVSQKKARSQSLYQNQITTQKLKESLYNQQTSRYGQRAQRNPVIESIVKEADVVMTNQHLKENLFKLKEMGLLRNCQPIIQTQSGLKKKDYILNDYHNKSTLNGYSRNYGGLFYNK